jgi:nucleoside-triphosphatase THEP1
MFSIENQNDNILNGNGLNNTILQTNSLFIPELKNTDTKTTLIVGKTDLSNDDILILSTWDYWFKNQEKYRPSSLDLLGLSSELCALCFLGRAIVKLAHTENSPLIIHVGNEIRMIRKHNKYNKWESNEELTWAEYLKKTYEEEKMNIINNMNDMECQSQDLENIINENSSQQRKLKDIIHIISALASITTQENQIILLKIFLERISLVSNILPVDYQNEIITARAVLELCSQNVTSLPNPKNITQILFKVGNSISMDHVQSFDLFVISYSLSTIIKIN